jgi:hypothetical protein
MTQGRHSFAVANAGEGFLIRPHAYSDRTVLITVVLTGKGD